MSGELAHAGRCRPSGRSRRSTAWQAARGQAPHSGAWQLSRDSQSAAPVILASGTYSPAPGIGAAHTLTLTVNGTLLTASIDGTQLALVTGSTYSTGVAGICTGGWYPVHFDNMTVAPPS